jgi:hypothetical protein
MYSGSAYLNNDGPVLGENIVTGNVNLFEYNVDRNGADQSLITPFLSPNAGLTFRTERMTPSDYAPYRHFSLSGSYPLTSSMHRQFYAATKYPFPDGTAAEKDTYSISRRELIALQNTMNYNRFSSDKFHYSGSYVSGAVNMLQIPSIMYGEQIKKGTVNLKFYYTGSLIDEAVDSRQNGELISTMGGTSGSIVGVVLYREGFILLTSSVEISSNEDDYLGTGTLATANWQHFGAYDSLSTGVTNFATASLFSVEFEGTQKVPVMTMFSTAQPGQLNNSLNPTWISSSDSNWKNRTASGPSGYMEPNKTEIKNTIESRYCSYEDEFQKQTYITEVGIYDKNKNLLGVAKLANPVQKKEADSYTFKLTLDM